MTVKIGQNDRQNGGGIGQNDRFLFELIDTIARYL